MALEGASSPLDWASSMTREWEEEMNIQKIANSAQKEAEAEEIRGEDTYDAPEFMADKVKQFETEIENMIRPVKEKSTDITVDPPVKPTTFIGDQVEEFSSGAVEYLGRQKLLSRAIQKRQNTKETEKKQVLKVPIFLESEVEEFESMNH